MTSRSNHGRRALPATVSALALALAPTLGSAPARGAPERGPTEQGMDVTAAVVVSTEAEEEEPAPVAIPDDPLERCVQAHARARAAVDNQRLLEARPILRDCAREGCPIALRAECEGWRREADRLAPTVVLAASSTAGDAERVRVYLDGRLVAERLDGNPLEVTPGPHGFRFELPGRDAIETRVVISLGEKNRVVRADFGGLASSSPTAPPATLPPPPATPRGNGKRTGLVLGGVALVSAATAATLLGVGLREQKLAENDCAPNCSQARVNQTRRWFILADTLGLAAGVTGGFGVYLYLDARHQPRSTAFGVTFSQDF